MIFFIVKRHAEKEAVDFCTLICKFVIRGGVRKEHTYTINGFYLVFYTLKSSCNPNLNSKYYKIL